MRVYTFAVYRMEVDEDEDEEEEEKKKKKNRCMHVRHASTDSQNDKTYAIGDRLYISNLFFLLRVE